MASAEQTVEQSLVFPLTRGLFLFAGVMSLIASFIFAVELSYRFFEKPSSPVVAVDRAEVVPASNSGMNSRQSNSGNSGAAPNQPRPPVLNGTNIDTLVGLFTQAGLPEDGVRVVLSRLILEAVGAGDDAKGYIDNAISILSTIPKADRQECLDSYHRIRLKRIDATNSLELAAASTLAQQKSASLMRAGISVIAFIQCALVLCLLAIERNSRGA